MSHKTLMAIGLVATEMPEQVHIRRIQSAINNKIRACICVFHHYRLGKPTRSIHTNDRLCLQRKNYKKKQNRAKKYPFHTHMFIKGADTDTKCHTMHQYLLFIDRFVDYSSMMVLMRNSKCCVNTSIVKWNLFCFHLTILTCNDILTIARESTSNSGNIIR